MSTTITSEFNLQRFLELNLNPEPVVIGKGAYFTVVNYTLGSNLEVVTESGAAPNYFYRQIYNPELIENLIIGVGVTLELTRDIFISGTLSNFGTITGGQVFETDVQSILTGLNFSWESDLGVENIAGEAQSWTDNIAGLLLEAPSESQRPIFLEVDEDFKGLPSLGGEIAAIRKLTSLTNLDINSSSISVFTVLSGIAQASEERIFEYSENVNSLLISRQSTLELRTQAIGTVGISTSDSPILPNNTAGLGLTTWEIGEAIETHTFLDSGEGTQVDSSLNTGSLTNGTLDVFANAASNSIYSGKIPSLLIYDVLNNDPKKNSISQYLTRKYIRNTFGITTVEANDQKLTLSKSVAIGELLSLTFIFNEIIVTGNNYLLIDDGVTLGFRVSGDGTVQGIAVNDINVYVNGVLVGGGGTDLSDNVGDVITITANAAISALVNYVGGFATLSTSIVIINYKMANEAFNLPEGSGLTTVGTDGTVCTLENGATWNPYNGK